MRPDPRQRCSPTDAGFSLIELMVALAVFALTVLALLNLAGENTRSAMVIEESVLTGVVADNRAVEAMLAAPGELATEGRELAGDREWRWARTVSATESDRIVRIDIRVQPADEDRLVSEISLFRSAP